MITLSLSEAAANLKRLHEQLTAGEDVQSATLIEGDRPVLAVLPWELYKSLLELADIANDPRTLMKAKPETRRRALALATARAEHMYSTDRDLTDFEAFGEEDLLDVTS